MSLGVSWDDRTCQGWPYLPSLLSGTINVIQVWTSRTGGSWHTFYHARKLKSGTQVKNHISWWYMISKMTPSSKTPVRNHQRPPGMTLRTEGFWSSSIHARKLKFGKQLKNHISWCSMMSRMTLSTKTPVRNHQRPPSMDFKDGRFLTLFQLI